MLLTMFRFLRNRSLSDRIEGRANIYESPGRSDKDINRQLGE